MTLYGTVFRKIGIVAEENLDDFLEWGKSVELTQNLLKSRNSEESRGCAWIKMGSNLQAIKPINDEDFIRHKILLPKSGLVYQANYRFETFCCICIKRAYKESIWHSALVSKGRCTPHREHSIFQSRSIIVPLEETMITFNPGTIKREEFALKTGSVYRMNCKNEYKFDGYVIQVFMFKPDWERFIPDKHFVV